MENNYRVEGNLIQHKLRPWIAWKITEGDIHALLEVINQGEDFEEEADSLYCAEQDLNELKGQLVEHLNEVEGAMKSISDATHTIGSVHEDLEISMSDIKDLTGE